MKGVVDTDILLKMAQYGLLAFVLSSLADDLNQIGILGAARFMARKRIHGTADSKTGEDMETIFEQLQDIEPTTEEARIAAEIEFQAIRHSVSLDEGESILCAITTSRSLDWLATDDKRAVVALEILTEHISNLKGLVGKVICLESIILRLLKAEESEKIRTAICSNPQVDTTLAICFCCNNPESSLQEWVEGLSSYLAALQRKAPTILKVLT